MLFPAIDMVEGRTVNLTGEDAVGPVVPLGQAWLSMSDTIWWSSVLPAGVSVLSMPVFVSLKVLFLLWLFSCLYRLLPPL